MDFTAPKYSGQGSFTVKKGAIDKRLFLPIASVNDFLQVLTLTRKMEKICCIISIPSLYNIVIIVYFDFNNFQID